MQNETKQPILNMLEKANASELRIITAFITSLLKGQNGGIKNMEQMKKAALAATKSGHEEKIHCGNNTTDSTEKSRTLWNVADDLDQNICRKAEQLESTALALTIAIECGGIDGSCFAGVAQLMLDTLHELAKCAESLSSEVLRFNKEETPC